MWRTGVRGGYGPVQDGGSSFRPTSCRTWGVCRTWVGGIPGGPEGVGLCQTNVLRGAGTGKVLKCYRSPPRKPGVPLASAASRRPKGAGTPGFRGGPQCSRERWVHSAMQSISGLPLIWFRKWRGKYKIVFSASFLTIHLRYF